MIEPQFLTYGTSGGSEDLGGFRESLKSATAGDVSDVNGHPRRADAYTNASRPPLLVNGSAR